MMTMLRSVLFIVVLLGLAHLTIQFTLDKRGAAWFLRPNWKPPVEKRFVVDDMPRGAYNPAEYDPFTVY